MIVNEDYGLKESFRTSRYTDFDESSESIEILVLAPNTEIDLNIPINIAVDFKTNDDAKIQINSLQVLYGFFEFDITERIKKHASITELGIRAKNVKLPEGSHKIIIKIRDSKNRTAEKSISFKIVG